MGRLVKQFLAAMTLNCTFVYLTGELVPGVFFEGGLPTVLLTGLVITGVNWPLRWLVGLLPGSGSDSVVQLLAVYLGCNILLMATSSALLSGFIVAGTLPLIAAGLVFAVSNYVFMSLAGVGPRSAHHTDGWRIDE